MRFIIFGLLVAFLFAVATSAPQRNNKCQMPCPLNYQPVCGSPKNGQKLPDLSFGNACVLETYNCEHKDAPYAVKSQGECPGVAGIRLQ